MDGPGRRPGGRLVEVVEEEPGVYRVVVEDEDGERRVYRVAARDGVLETPWGVYPVSLAHRRHSGGRGRQGRLGWLVDVRDGVVRARLPVRVVRRLAEPGSVVGEGEPVLVVETMKMLNEVPSPCRGRLVEAAEPGGSVGAGGVLFRVECGG